MMVLSSDTVWCQGCGVEILWSPYLKNNHLYCCEECADGKPCQCSDRMELDDERKPGSLPGIQPY